MSATTLYRISAVLLVLFAVGHQLGFRKVAPEWHADDVVSAMRATQFTVQGFSRNYWGFFSGFGFFVTALLLFSACLAWQLGRMPADVLARLSLITWGFAACYVVIALMTWKYFFTAPGVFATAVALCLVLAAVLAGRVTPAVAVVQQYFDRLERGAAWQDLFADDVAFTSHTDPVNQVTGREPFLDSTKRFYGSIASVALRELGASGDKAFALTRYGIRGPDGTRAFDSDVAEVFHVKGGKIAALDIYFDSAPYPRRPPSPAA